MDSKHGHRWAETVETCTINQDSSLGRREVVCFVSLRLFCSRFIFLSIGFDLEIIPRGFVGNNRFIIINKETYRILFFKIHLFIVTCYSDFISIFIRDQIFVDRETFENTNFIVVFQSQVFQTSRMSLKFRSLFQMLGMSFTVDAENIRSFYVRFVSKKEILKSFARLVCREKYITLSKLTRTRGFIKRG